MYEPPFYHLQETSIDMEQEFLNIGLDIIGLGVFNYDFGSISTESPVIKVQKPSCDHVGGRLLFAC